MTALTDETLSAYADGMLAPFERRRIQAILISNHSLQAQVHALRRIANLIEEAFAEPDYQTGIDRLVRVVRRRGPSLGPIGRYFSPSRVRSSWPVPERRTQAGGRSGYLALAGVAVAASGLLVVGALVVGAVILRQPAPGIREEIAAANAFTLGEIDRRSHLWKALEAFERGEGAAPDAAHLRAIGHYADRYANSCHELDVLQSPRSRVLTGTLLACQPEKGRWSLIAAVGTRSPERAEARPYATDEAEAHEALAGILKMIGARQLTTSLDREKIPQ